MRRGALIPFLLACLIGAGWLNQGMRRSLAEARAAELDPQHHPLNLGRYLLYLTYMRSDDEERYQAVASALRGLPYDHRRLNDRGTGTAAAIEAGPPEDGHWHRPYTEVPVEYPIAMLPLVLLPSFVGGTSFEIYARTFGLLMTALLLAGAALAVRAQPGRDRREQWTAMACLLLAEGSLAVQRLDAVLALLLALAFWAAAERRPWTLGTALGLATAAKFLPLLLVAPLVAADWEAWASARARTRALVGFATAAALGFLPMLFPPSALLDVLHYHGARGLQVESTWAVLIAAGKLLSGTAVPAEWSFGSWNLPGPLASFCAQLSMPVTLLLMALITVFLARVPKPADDLARRDRLALALLLGLAALWLSAKVFSPQYLTWGLPLVLGVSGSRGRRLTWLFFAVLVATQVILCGLYVFVFAVSWVGEIALLVRLALLIALVVALVRDVATPHPSISAFN